MQEAGSRSDCGSGKLEADTHVSASPAHAGVQTDWWFRQHGLQVWVPASS
jgi:hypothetical protein